MIKMKSTFWDFNPKGEHSKYSPSSYKRWKACPASIKLADGIYIPSKAYNIRGTLCHDLAEAFVRREFLAFPYKEPWQITEILKKREEEEHDSDDILWVSRSAIDAVEYFVRLVGDVQHILFEKRIPICGESWGSADVCIIGSQSCVILDYKFGNAPVSAQSEQLKAYLMGIFANMENVPEHYNFIAGVYQPSVSAGYDEWCYSVYDMVDGLKEMANDIEETKKPNLLPNDGSHCFFCPACQTTDPERKCPMIKMKMSDKIGASLFEAHKEYEGN